MSLNPQRLEEGSTDDGDYPNTSSTDDLAAGVSASARGAWKMMIIQILQLVGPILVPSIRQVVKEEIGLALQGQELLTSMKENPAIKASTSVPRKLKLQIRSKISLPVFTGKPLLGENQTPIEIALVDARTEQIVNTGTESTTKLEIVGFRVGDDDSNGDIWTSEEIQKRIVSGKEGKRILQGKTFLQLKEGIVFVSKISFTHAKDHTKKGWYRLGARVVDAALMNGVEVAWTEAFLMKDGRAAYYEKHHPPSLSDKVYHLHQISFKSACYKRLKDAGVNTVKDFLTLLHTNPERLKDIIKPRASKIWDDMVNHAQTSDGMFLYLDSSNEQKTSIVLNVKLQLKGLIVESHQYMPVDQLSDKQKIDTQLLVKFACEHLEVLHSFDDETSLTEHLQSGTGFSSLISANQSLGTSKIIDGPPRPSAQVTYSSPGLTEAPDNLNNSNLHMGQSTNQAPMVTSQSEWGKETVLFDNEMTCFMNHYQEDISFHPLNLESSNGLNFGTATEKHAPNPTEPGTSSQAVELPLGTCGRVNNFNIFSQSLDCLMYTPDFLEELHLFPNYDSILHCECPNNQWHSEPANSDADFLMVTAQTVSAQTRWTKVSKLLRRLSVRERISLPEGIQARKKQRCC